MSWTTFTFHNFHSLDPFWCVESKDQNRENRMEAKAYGDLANRNVAFHFNKENLCFLLLTVYRMIASHLEQIRLIPTSFFHKNIFERDESKKCNNLIGNRQKYEYIYSLP